MKPDEVLLAELARCTTGANVHQAKNLEYAYRGFCRLSERARSEDARDKARREAEQAQQEIRDLIQASQTVS